MTKKVNDLNRAGSGAVSKSGCYPCVYLEASKAFLFASSLDYLLSNKSVDITSRISAYNMLSILSSADLSGQIKIALERHFYDFKADMEDLISGIPDIVEVSGEDSKDGMAKAGSLMRIGRSRPGVLFSSYDGFFNAIGLLPFLRQNTEIEISTDMRERSAWMAVYEITEIIKSALTGIHKDIIEDATVDLHSIFEQLMSDACELSRDEELKSNDVETVRAERHHRPIPRSDSPVEPSKDLSTESPEGRRVSASALLSERMNAGKPSPMPRDEAITAPEESSPKAEPEPTATDWSELIEDNPKIINEPKPDSSSAAPPKEGKKDGTVSEVMKHSWGG